MIPRLEIPLGLSTRHQVAAPVLAARDPNLDRSRQPASISSFLSSIRGSLVSRIPSLVIKFHIYKKIIIISKHISPPCGEPNLTTKLFNKYSSSKKKDPSIGTTRSADHPTALPRTWYMASSSWDFISFTRQHPPYLSYKK